MVATIPFNPNVTTVASGAFDVQTNGYVQGDVMPDPAIIYKRASGTLSQSETLPMWGSVGIFTDIGGASGNPASQLGTIVGRATSLADLVAFSTFPGAYGMINTPSSPVPLAASGMQVMYYRLGSGARIVVAADASLVSLQSGLTTQDVSWDFVNQKLIPYLGTTAIASGTYNSGTGLVTLTFSSAHGINPGDTFTVSGATGTGSYADIDGTFQAGAATSGVNLTYTIATGLTLTITGANVATSGILPVQVLDIQANNCMTVSYNSGTNSASWAYNTAAALILI